MACWNKVCRCLQRCAGGGVANEERREARERAAALLAAPRPPQPEASWDPVTREPSSSRAFVFSKMGTFLSVYDIKEREIGTGSYGTVSKARHKESGAVRAIKTIPKRRVPSLESLRHEVEIMKAMDHPNVIKLFETFEDVRNLYLVLELCEGGELFDRIIADHHFTEAVAARVMEQMFRAVYYMHSKCVVHRDLKPENFLFVSKDPIPQTIMKLIDFGMATYHRDKGSASLKTRIGTPYYVAPDVLRGSYDERIDEWSCGVIMYVLLCGYPPFRAENDHKIVERILLGQYSFASEDWKSVSEDAKELIGSLLRMSSRERCTAEQALSHEWVRTRAAKASGRALKFSLCRNLSQFQSQSKLKKAALHIMARRANEEQIEHLRNSFLELDSGSGTISLAELKEGLRREGLLESGCCGAHVDVQQLLASIDADGSGTIDYSEFIAATLERRQYLQEDLCWAAFRVFDVNGDGKISREELHQVLSDESISALMDLSNVSSSDSIIQEADRDGDGSIDFEEFMHAMRSFGAVSEPRGAPGRLALERFRSSPVPIRHPGSPKPTCLSMLNAGDRSQSVQ